MDFCRPLARKPQGDLRLAREATLVWGAVLLVIGGFARYWGGVLEAGLTIASIAYGGLLGVFLLGMLPRRVPETAAMIGMAAGVAAVVGVKLGTHIAWTWYVAIGTLVTLCSALVVSPLIGGSSRDRE